MTTIIIINILLYLYYNNNNGIAGIEIDVSWQQGKVATAAAMIMLKDSHRTDADVTALLEALRACLCGRDTAGRNDGSSFVEDVDPKLGSLGRFQLRRQATLSREKRTNELTTFHVTDRCCCARTKSKLFHRNSAGVSLNVHLLRRQANEPYKK